MAQAAAHALHAGVTTVRDLGARGDLIFRLRRLIESGTVEGPHILAAGRALTIPRGHCYFLGGVAENEAELLGLVRTEIERGADVIKIMATGGAMTPSSDPTRPQFAPETLARAVDLAHSLGRPVAAHAHSREGMRDAVAAGVDTIEHGTFLGADGARVHDDDLALFPDSGTVLVATLAPVAARRQVPGADGGPIARELSAAEIWERRRADVGRLHAAGARVIAGSDCGVTNVPHDAVIEEIACLVEAGLSAAQALAAATSSAADVLGVGAHGRTSGARPAGGRAGGRGRPAARRRRAAASTGRLQGRSARDLSDVGVVRARHIRDGAPARSALLRGMQRMTSLVRPTLGPLPRTIAIDHIVGSRPPEVLDNAALIARRTLQLRDPFEDMGGMLIRHLVWRVYDQVGDGAATAAVLAEALTRAGVRYIAAGGNPIPIRRGMQAGLEVVVAELERQARAIDGPDEIARASSAACAMLSWPGSSARSSMPWGPTAPSASRTPRARRPSHEYIDGVRWNEGYVSPFLLDQDAGSTIRLLDPRILVTDYVLERAEDVLPTLEACVAAGEQRLFIVAPEIRDGVVGVLVANRQRGVLDGAIAVRAPLFGSLREGVLEDIAAITGGRTCLRRAAIDSRM